MIVERGVTHIGENIKSVSQILAVDNAIYASGDILIAGSNELADFFLTEGGNAILQTVIIRSNKGTGTLQDPDLDVLIISKSGLTGTANDAFAFAGGIDKDDVTAVISFIGTDYKTMGADDNIAIKTDLNLPIIADSSTRALNFTIISRDTPTYAADGQVTIEFIGYRN